MEFEMNYATPESCGISSADIEEYIRALEAKKLVTHDIIITKGDNLVFETYWKPFDEKFLHRMYLCTVAYSCGIGIIGIDVHLKSEVGVDAHLNVIPAGAASAKDVNRNGVTVGYAELHRLAR